MLLQTHLFVKVLTESTSVTIFFEAPQESHHQIQLKPVLPSLPTPVKIQPLAKLLSGYDPIITKLLISGFSHGFSLHYQGGGLLFESRNLLSALQNPTIVDMKLAKELAASRLIGPFMSIYVPFLPSAFYLSV